MFWLKAVLAIVFIVFNTQAFAQDKPEIVAKPDSTFVLQYVQLDSVLVTPNGSTPAVLKRNRNALTHGNAAHKLAADSELTSSIPGVTADLERDLPGLVMFYSANGIPILTKQSQNHSLTPTMAYAVISPTVGEPTAIQPGPDAVVTLTPSYENRRNMIFDPLHQRGSFVVGEQKMFSVGLVAEHSFPGLLEEYIEELSAYASIYSGLLSARFKTPRSKIEVTGQHQVSENEFGAMFDVNRYEVNDYMSTLFASAIHKRGIVQFEAGYGFQLANSRTDIDEFYLDNYYTKENLLSNSYKFSLKVKNTSVTAFYHDLKRSWVNFESEIQNTQVLLSHQQTLSRFAHLIVSTRVDHHDDVYKQSVSGQLMISATRSLLFEINVAHLYDPLTSHVMNSSIRYVEDSRTEQPITTSYASLQTRYYPEGWEIMTNLIVRRVDQDWFNKSSQMEGFVLGASIMRTFTWGDKALSLKVNTRKRWIDLIVDDQPKFPMPGPPPLEAGFRTEYGTNRFGFLIDSQLHLNRNQMLSEEFIVPLGNLIMLNAGFTTRFGPANLGLTVGNVLGSIYDNNLYAYQRRVNEQEREIEFVQAAFYPGLSVEIDF